MAATYGTHTLRDNTTATTTPVGDKPDGVVDGSLLIAHLYTRGDTTQVIDVGTSGFTKLGQTGGTAQGQQASFYKVVTDAASEPATYTFSFSVSQHGWVAIWRIDGADTTNPIEYDSGIIGGTGTDQVSLPGYTPAQEGNLLVCLAAVGTNVFPNWTPPASMTEHYDNGAASGTTSRNVAGFSEAWNSTTATGQRDPVADGGSGKTGQLLGIKPLGAPLTALLPNQIVSHSGFNVTPTVADIDEDPDDAASDTSWLTVTDPSGTIGDITHVASSAVATGSTSVAPSYPGGIANNDIAILFAFTHGTTNDLTFPSGWTKVGTFSEAGEGSRGAWAWRRLSGSESGAQTVSGGSSSMCGAISVFRGVRTSGDPYDVADGGLTISGTDLQTRAGITTLLDKAHVVLMVGVADD